MSQTKKSEIFFIYLGKGGVGKTSIAITIKNLSPTIHA